MGKKSETRIISVATAFGERSSIAITVSARGDRFEYLSIRCRDGDEDETTTIHSEDDLYLLYDMIGSAIKFIEGKNGNRII